MRAQTHSYSIRQLVDITGLSEFTIRGWENRYGAFNPVRTSTGRRLYSDPDLQKAILLRELTLRDHRIGDIADCTHKQLRSLIEYEPTKVDLVPLFYQEEIETILRSLSLQQWDQIESGLRRVTRAKKTRIVLRDFIVPLVRELGRRVESGVISIAQEHIFSALLKERLYVLLNSAKVKNSSKRFLVAAPEGDLHELGILIAHAMLLHSGYKSLYLGANTPKKELCETAHRYRATNLLLGSTVSQKEGAKEDFFSYFHFLDRHINQDVSIWLGGRNLTAAPLDGNREVVYFASLADLDQALEG